MHYIHVPSRRYALRLCPDCNQATVNCREIYSVIGSLDDLTNSGLLYVLVRLGALIDGPSAQSGCAAYVITPREAEIN